MIKEETINQNLDLGQANLLTSIKRFFLSLFILSLMYCNFFLIAVKLPDSPRLMTANKFFHKITFASENLPLDFNLFIPKFAYDLFDTFSVFAYYETINRDFIIMGLKEGAQNADDPSNWKELSIVNRYFPFHLGEQQTRLYLGKHYNLGMEALRENYKILAAKIRERYNLENPSAKVQKISIIVSYWPRSANGYRALKDKDTVQTQTLYMEQ